MAHLRRLSDGDARLLRTLIHKYGLDGMMHEVVNLLRSWGEQDKDRYKLLQTAAMKFEYRCRVEAGTAPRLYKHGTNPKLESWVQPPQPVFTEKQGIR